MTRSPLITVPAAAGTAARGHGLPPGLFATFLGHRMSDTCGLYRHAAATLDEAQETRLQFIAGCLQIQGGESVLDIGTGWGSLAFFLAERFACQVTVVTPSSAQARYINDRAAATGLSQQIRVAEVPVHDLELTAASFDAVTLVEAIEHMPEHHRTLSTAAMLLRGHGRLYLSASCYRSRAVSDQDAACPEIRRVTATGLGRANFRPLSALVESAEEAGLSLCQLSDLTRHYHRTMTDWMGGLRACRARIDSLAPGYAEELIRFLETANADWGHLIKHYAFTAVRSGPDRPADSLLRPDSRYLTPIRRG